MSDEVETAARVRTPYRLAHVTVDRVETLTPHLRRFTFKGADVAELRTCAPDQRIKLFFPETPDQRPVVGGADWYARYKRLPPALRPAMRTYTIRHVRRSPDEMDVDFVVHGDTGPASRWALRARPGDRLQMTAPDRGFDGDPGGYEWRPPARVRRLLLAADETALPALAGILDALAGEAEPPETDAFVETPTVEDRLPLSSWPGLRLHWLERGDGRPGEALVAAVSGARLSTETAPSSAGPALADVDVDQEILWDRASGGDGAFYAWVAGEAGAVLAIRRLFAERGVDRRAANLMGYWRVGRVLD